MQNNPLLYTTQEQKANRKKQKYRAKFKNIFDFLFVFLLFAF